MTIKLSAGGAETLESRKSSGHHHRGASLITCSTACPGCTPEKGDRARKKKRLVYSWTQSAFICMASASPIAQDDLSLVFPSFQGSMILLNYSNWSLKEMHTCSGIVPLPVVEVLATALVLARAEDTVFLWAHGGSLCCMPRHCAGFEADCRDVVPIPMASAPSFIITAIEPEIQATSLLSYLLQPYSDSFN